MPTLRSHLALVNAHPHRSGRKQARMHAWEGHSPATRQALRVSVRFRLPSRGLYAHERGLGEATECPRSRLGQYCPPTVGQFQTPVDNMQAQRAVRGVPSLFNMDRPPRRL
jgi:hypothetical protein